MTWIRNKVSFSTLSTIKDLMNSKPMNPISILPPERLQADVKLPASKSISNRALIICALYGGQPLPQNLSDCDDTEVVIRALSQLAHGVSAVEASSGSSTIDIKAAGTAMRFMTAFLAATPNGEHVLTGTERMRHRPIRVLVDALRHLGASIEYAGEEGFPPLRIKGQQLEGGQIEIDGSVSSQFISALLLIGPVLRQGLTLRLTDSIISRPYIDLTLWVMRELGAKVEWTSVDTITVEPKGYVARPFLVENDWSAASYWYEMVALSPDPEAKVRLHGLMDGSKQGDSIVRYIFSLLGVKTRFSSREPGKPTTVTLTKSTHRVVRLDYDFTGAPDLAQTIVVTCCLLGVPFHFTGLQTLRIKETDRLDALQREMQKLGYHLTIHGDSGLSWQPQTSNLKSQTSNLKSIDTYDDHRMALAFAPVALCRPVIINNPQVVTKSYPHYWEHLRQAGFTVS